MNPLKLRFATNRKIPSIRNKTKTYTIYLKIIASFLTTNKFSYNKSHINH